MKRALLATFFLLFSAGLFAQYRFIENKGQWPDNVNFRAEIAGGYFYAENGALLFDFYDSETVSSVFGSHRGIEPIPVPDKLKCHAYKMTLAGANALCVEGQKPFKTFYSFYTRGKVGKGALAFEEIRYPGIYEGIDLKIYSRNNLKYDFIVKPSGDPSEITIVYEGVKPRLNNKGELELKTSLGKIIESEPFAYQVINDQVERVVCSYSVEGREVSFVLGDYNPEYELIIDPELVFSTYSGSFSDNFGYSATFDIDGHLYSGSTAFGTQYPVTTGAYQVNWAGGVGAGTIPGTDIAISKFNLEGTDLEYSTYLGGSGDELPHSLIADSLGNLYIFGTTGSADFPVTDGAYQTTFLGGAPTLLGGVGIDYNEGADIIVAALSANGQDLIASTYVGGTENDGTNTSLALKYNYADEVRGEIEIDVNGNILVGSCTDSDDFPISTNALQNSKGAGQDGVFFVLNPEMTTLLASTFIGGDGDDAVYSIHYESAEEVTLGGGTDSEDLAVPENAYQSEFQGGQSDGFLLTVNEQATVIQSGTYLGTNQYDQIYFVERDALGAPHVFGQTESTGTELFINANYGQEGRGMFVSKFNGNLESLIWSTTFGNSVGTPPLSPVAFAVDICNRIYLSGWGGAVNTQGNTLNLEVTDDALQSSTDGSDFYFMVLDGDANGLTFASFYGGNQSAEHVDGGTSRFDRGGKIYQAVCAGCGSNDDFPIAPANALSPTNNSTNCNLGVAKIDFDLPLVLADYETDDICLPGPVTFINTSETFADGNPTYLWTFPNGDEFTTENVDYQFNSPGTYEVELIISDPLACNLSDTIVQTVSVFSELELDVPSQVINCDTSVFEIEANTSGTATFYTWAEDVNFTDVILAGETDSVLTYSSIDPTTIYLEVDNGLCTEVRPIFLAPPILAELSIGDTVLCNTDVVEVSVEILNDWAEVDILWIPETDVIEGQGTETATFLIPEGLGISAIIENEFGCLAGPKATIETFDIALLAPDDTLLCTDEELTLTAISFGTAEEFIWSNNPDFSDPLNPPTDSVITITPGALELYYILVNNNGCALQDTVAVSLLEAGTSISPDQFICQGDTALIFVSNDFPGSNLSHVWEPDELILSGQGTSIITSIIEETTTFSVVSTTEDGCTVENSSTILPSPLGGETIDATANPVAIVVGESSQLSVVPINEEYFYQWEPPDFLDNPFLNNPTSTPSETIEYIVTIIDADPNGLCQKSDTVIVQVFDFLCGTPNIFVPNAFTPNGDGENDVVFVRGGGITDIKFSIFNRWGEEVFYTEDQSVGWDGTYKGDLAEPAVFVYHLEAVCDEGETFFGKGNITLIR